MVVDEGEVNRKFHSADASRRTTVVMVSTKPESDPRDKAVPKWQKAGIDMPQPEPFLNSPVAVTNVVTIIVTRT
ncbi:MAG: hypothetical protein COW32_09745 [Candidatus Aquicultor secundus]|nr:MAG: hypothetical protein AUK32_01135 [Candidatus Aquicultor secundus]PIW21491.1 MAG: hypothetical protein COW32_09745 [Candidatus Aquicultor secundus]